MRVLIVDDARETLEMLSLALSLLGHEAITATGGEQAIQLVESEKPDLVLLDLMMPGMDGYETLQRIRALPDAGDTPVLVTTASLEENLEQRVYEVGADGILRKPLNLDDLREALARHSGGG